MADVPQDKITEKPDTIQILNSAVCSNLPTVSFLSSESHMADVNQSDCMYGDAAGRQCMPTCYLAIAKLKLERSCNNWSEWILGKVIECLPSRDGQVRRVKVLIGDRSSDLKTFKPSVLERPIHKLVVLVEGNKDSDC